MANVVIDIAAEFTGGNAFRKAETATDKLNKTAGKLGKAFIGLYSTQKLLAFGKASIQAAAQDEKAQKQLALALKNVGLGRDAVLSEAYIQKLQTEFGILDDELRPAYQQLAVATQNTVESQRLFQIALDISASRSLDLGSVTSALSKAFLGSNTALGKLGVGISKADLKTKSFKEITDQLATTFAGSATESANSFQGSMDKLTVASSNAKEIIGKGLMDALEALGGDDSVENLAANMETFAQKTADAISGLGIFFAQLKEDFPILEKFFKFAGSSRGFAQALGEVARLNEAARAGNYPSGGFPGSDEGYKGLEKYVREYRVLTAEELKQLKAKQLKLAIDKATLALNKGSNVFDIDKIQLAAAELNQAQLLSKVTNSAQLLQITNDMARLNVKQSILALEEAIASKDIKAIEAGTAKLNGDLKILGVLSGQELKLRDIESILKDIVPKDLINIANLDAAIAKLKLIGDTKTIVPLGTPTAPSNKPLTPSQVEDLLVLGRTVPIVPDSSGGVGYSSTAGNYASSGFPGSAMGYGGGTTKVEVTVVAPAFTDPNAVAEAINQYLQDATDRGTLRVAV
jgi:hypothetical protein